MALAILLFPSARAPVSLGTAAIPALADLGVTHAAILGDGEMFAVVLDGWAFDPAGSGRTAADLIAGPDADCRMLGGAEEIFFGRGMETKAIGWDGAP